MRSRIWIAASLLALLASSAPLPSLATEPAPVASTSASEPDSQSVDDASSDPVAQHQSEIYRAYAKATFNSLRTSSNPRDWALAALVNPLTDEVPSEQEQTALIDRALAAAPGDAIMPWIALTVTHRSSRSDMNRDAIVQTLQHRESDNAAVWMETLTLASKRKDKAAVDVALTHMATSVRNDEHFSDLLKAQLDVFKRYPLPDEYFAILAPQNSGSSSTLSRETAPYVAAMAVTAAFGLPAYQFLIQECAANPSTGENGTRAVSCATIGRRMVAHGTTMLANRVGSTVLRRSRTFNDDDVQRARTQDWIWQQKSTLYGSTTTEPPLEEIIADINNWIDTGSEIESWRRALVRAGKPLTPPADWVDENSPFSPERLHNDQLAADRAAQAH